MKAFVMKGLDRSDSGRLRMERLLQAKRLDPTAMTTHTFPFAQLDRAFEMMDKKLDGVIKPFIKF